MRITSREHIAIVQAVQAQDPAAQIFLYGSRTDDQALGGDIDVLLLSQKIKFANKLDIMVSLRQSLGERKIDLVVFPDASKPFAQVALEKSIHLNP
jgi:uncharacterized protein